MRPEMRNFSWKAIYVYFFRVSQRAGHKLGLSSVLGIVNFRFGFPQDPLNSKSPCSPGLCFSSLCLQPWKETHVRHKSLSLPWARWRQVSGSLFTTHSLGPLPGAPWGFQFQLLTFHAPMACCTVLEEHCSSGSVHEGWHLAHLPVSFCTAFSAYNTPLYLRHRELLYFTHQLYVLIILSYLEARIYLYWKVESSSSFYQPHETGLSWHFF